MLLSCGFTVSKKSVVRNIVLLVCFMSQVATAQDEVSKASAVTNDGAAASEMPVTSQKPSSGSIVSGFPHWPERKQTNREIVPPPPPGPYMSSALSDYSIKGRSFSRGYNKQRPKAPSQNASSAVAPMVMFSPDRPWPKNLRGNKVKSNRWMPKNGYNYIAPGNRFTMPPAQQNNAATNVYRSAPPKQNTMGWPGMNNTRMNTPNFNNSGQRWIPSMSMGKGANQGANPSNVNQRNMNLGDMNRGNVNQGGNSMGYAPQRNSQMPSSGFNPQKN